MGTHIVHFSDLGEGIVEAEIVEWFVEVGDSVTSDSVLVAVTTDKATVEVSAPFDGTIAWLGAQPGDVISVGCELAGIDRGAEAPESSGSVSSPGAVESPQAPERASPQNDVAVQNEHNAAPPSSQISHVAGAPPGPAAWEHSARPLAQPSVRKRARELGIELRTVPASGRGGRITHEDLDRYLIDQAERGNTRPDPTVTSHPVRGVRRAIADKMTTAWQRIPHITYVEEVDVTELESLRGVLNRRGANTGARLTLLPFLIRALVAACADRPNMSATFDDDEGVVHQSAAVHTGVATQTSNGLVVPVVRHVEMLDVWQLAAAVSDITERARAGRLGRDDLTGSTITVSSLGALGGLVTTPIINHPEVAVIGVNKIQIRPVWQDDSFVPRKMMNLSSSFDHRIIDGWDAAEFVQHIKLLLETPALLFMGEPR